MLVFPFYIPRDGTSGGLVLSLAVILAKAFRLKGGLLVRSACQLPSVMLLISKGGCLTVELAGLLGLTLVDFTLQGVSLPYFLQTMYHKHAQQCVLLCNR